jgi:hypothetical protein
VTDLRRLQYFLAVARERNFTRAAEQLHVAQPALSRQVRLLEEELGVGLLHRTTHAFELTEAGAFLLERGPAALAAVDELWRSVRTYGSGERGSVGIGYGASASYETAPRLLMYGPTVTPLEAALSADDAAADFEHLPATARRHGIVGHAQAAARARLDGRPRINRRDFVTFDDGIPGTHFVSLQRNLEDFNATRAVMNAADGPHHHPAVGLRANNGINAFMEVVSRATFAVPARAQRAYPAQVLTVAGQVSQAA